MRTAEEMRGLQRLPLDIKVAMTMDRIRQWVDTFGENGVCVSFSGGKDSTVLLHLVRTYAPNVKAVFSDTGLEYPEIRNFVKTFDNVDWIKPKMTFGQIVGQYGYPLFSKEISNTIWYARKIRGGGSITHFRQEITGKRLQAIKAQPLKDMGLTQVQEEKRCLETYGAETIFKGNGKHTERNQINPMTGKREKGTSRFLTKKNTCPLAENFPF